VILHEPSGIVLPTGEVPCQRDERAIDRLEPNALVHRHVIDCLPHGPAVAVPLVVRVQLAVRGVGVLVVGVPNSLLDVIGQCTELLRVEHENLKRLAVDVPADAEVLHAVNYAGAVRHPAQQCVPGDDLVLDRLDGLRAVHANAQLAHGSFLDACRLRADDLRELRGLFRPDLLAQVAQGIRGERDGKEGPVVREHGVHDFVREVVHEARADCDIGLVLLRVGAVVLRADRGDGPASVLLRAALDVSLLALHRRPELVQTIRVG